jgi:hypothetical protein
MRSWTQSRAKVTKNDLFVLDFHKIDRSSWYCFFLVHFTGLLARLLACLFACLACFHVCLALRTYAIG